MKTYFDNVRERNPLIQCMTNFVTVNDVANVLLASGASPTMADDLWDAPEIAKISDGLYINLGTLNEAQIKSIIATGKVATELGHTIVMDPVGVGASQIRTDTARELLEKMPFAAIRGNASEIKALFTDSTTTQGVDVHVDDEISEANLAEAISMVKGFAQQVDTVVIVSGAIDIISDGKKSYIIRNGRPEMSKVTGTGCQLTALVAAFITANPEHPLEASTAAVGAMGLAGEIGWSHMQPYEGNATYRNRMIDAIYHMSGAELAEGVKYECR